MLRGKVKEKPAKQVDLEAIFRSIGDVQEWCHVQIRITETEKSTLPLDDRLGAEPTESVLTTDCIDLECWYCNRSLGRLYRFTSLWGASRRQAAAVPIFSVDAVTFVQFWCKGVLYDSALP
jgi:hypothetical protein